MTIQPGRRRWSRLSSIVDSVTRRLWSSPTRSFAETIGFQQRSFQRGIQLVRAFYAISLVWIIREMGQWPGLLRSTALQPLWPVRWLDQVDLSTGIGVVLYGYLLAGLAVAIAPQWRLARIAYTVTLFEYMALIGSFGKVNGNLHGWLFASVFLVLLPNRGWHRIGSATGRHRFLTAIWAAGVPILFIYSLTGLWKLGYTLHDLVGPRMSGLNVDGFSLILASRMLETNQTGLLDDLVVNNPAIGWLLYNGTIYLETASLLIAFRPRLHRLWGFGLILFHVGTMLTMGFTFEQNIALVGLLFVCSPAAPEEFVLRDAVLDLPVVHLATRMVGRRSARRARRSPREDPGITAGAASQPS